MGAAISWVLLITGCCLNWESAEDAFIGIHWPILSISISLFVSTSGPGRGKLGVRINDYLEHRLPQGFSTMNERVNLNPNGIEPLGMDVQHVAEDLNRHPLLDGVLPVEPHLRICVAEVLLNF